MAPVTTGSVPTSRQGRRRQNRAMRWWPVSHRPQGTDRRLDFGPMPRAEVPRRECSAPRAPSYRGYPLDSAPHSLRDALDVGQYQRSSAPTIPASAAVQSLSTTPRRKGFVVAITGTPPPAAITIPGREEPEDHLALDKGDGTRRGNHPPVAPSRYLPSAIHLLLEIFGLFCRIERADGFSDSQTPGRRRPPRSG